MIVMAYCSGSNDKAWRPPGFLMGPAARFAAVLTFLSSLPLEKGKNDTIWGYQVTPASGEKDGLRNGGKSGVRDFLGGEPFRKNALEGFHFADDPLQLSSSVVQALAVEIYG